MTLGGGGGISMLITAGAALVFLGMASEAGTDHGDTRVLHVCIKKHGEIVIVRPNTPCQPHETARRWDLPSPTGLQEHPTRAAILKALKGLPCTIQGGPSGMVVEVRYYGTGRAPYLRCRVPGGRFIDHGDQTVTDTQTGLTWEKKVAGGDGRATCLTEPRGVDSACTWDQAMNDWLDVMNGACPSCRAAGGFAGYADWRLPTLVELLTIVDASQIPAIDPSFGMTHEGYYWSETTADAVDPPIAAGVHFFDGSADEIAMSQTIRVRAVRGP